MSGVRSGFTSLIVLAISFVIPISAAAAATPVDGGWIAYQWGGDIRLMREDGSEDHPLIPDWTGGDQFHPDWSPDGNQIAFSADDQDGSRDIWIANLDGSDATRIYNCIDPCAWADDPAFSPDGSAVLLQTTYSPDGGNHSSIQAVILATGMIEIIWMSDVLTDCIFGPRWSPDGSQIVFEVARFAEPSVDSETIVGSAIAMVDRAGTSPPLVTFLTEFDSFSSYPDWGRGNDSIVFTMAGEIGPDGPFDLYTIVPDGSDLTRLTEYAGTGFQAIQPTWSPDSTEIVFVYDQMWTNPVLARIDIASREITTAGVAATHPRQQP